MLHGERENNSYIAFKKIDSNTNNMSIFQTCPPDTQQCEGNFPPFNIDSKQILKFEKKDKSKKKKIIKN